MKQYGFNKATEFSRKQINVIWAKAKAGDIRVEKWFISELYNLAEYYGYDDNCSVERSERDVKNILDLVFAGKIEEAQKMIDTVQNDWFENKGTNEKKRCNRDDLVA